MDAISTSAPGIHIHDYADLSFMSYPYEKSSTGTVWSFELGDIAVFAENLDHLRYLARQIVHYCDQQQRRLEEEEETQVDAVAI